MKSKKASSAMEVPPWMIFILLVITVIVIIMYRQFGTFQASSSCETFGGALVDQMTSCNENVSSIFTPANEKDAVCCRKKSSVTTEEFEEWARTARVETDDSRSGNTVPVINPNYVPTSSSGIQEMVQSGDFPAGGSDYQIGFNGVSYLSGEPFSTPANKDFVITAIHRNEDAKYCKLYVVEAVRSGNSYSAKRNDRGQVISLPGMSYDNTDCDPYEGDNNQVFYNQLQIVNKIATPGMYKADFIVKESSTGDALASRSLIFEVTPSNIPATTGQPVAIPPTITITYSQDSRGNKLHCWVDTHINHYGQDSELFPPPEFYSATTTGSCTDVTYQAANMGSSTTINTEEKFCIKVDQEYTDEQGVVRTKVAKQTLEWENCDEITMYDPNQEFTQCTQSCEEQSPTSCFARTNECEFGIDCTIKKPLIGTDKCISCDSNIVNCADYRNEEACMNNECLVHKRCEWKSGFPSGLCVPYNQEI